MTRTELYALQTRIAEEGIIRGGVAEVKATLQTLLAATAQIVHIEAIYTGGEKKGQPYSDGWKLRNRNALVAEADRKRKANPDRDDLLAVYSFTRKGWRTIRVDSIQSVRLHIQPGVPVDVPVMADRPPWV